MVINKKSEESLAHGNATGDNKTWQSSFYRSFLCYITYGYAVNSFEIFPNVHVRLSPSTTILNFCK